MSSKPKVKKLGYQEPVWYRFFDPFVINFFDDLEITASQSTKDPYKPWSKRDWDDGFGCALVTVSSQESQSNTESEIQASRHEGCQDPIPTSPPERNVATPGLQSNTKERERSSGQSNLDTNNQESDQISQSQQETYPPPDELSQTFDEQPSKLRSSAGKEEPASPAPSSSFSVAWLKDPEGDKAQDPASEAPETVIIDKPILEAFLRRYFGETVDENWCQSVIRRLAKDCTKDPALQLEDVQRKLPNADERYKYHITREDRMLAVCQELSDLCVYCDQCKEYPVFFGIIREINDILDHTRHHSHLKPASLELLTKLLKAKAVEGSVLPGPLLDENYELSLEEGLRVAVDGLESIQRILLKLTPMLAAARQVLRQERQEENGRVQSERSN